MANELYQVNNPTPFQINIEKRFNFSIWDQVYFTSKVFNKVKSMNLPKRDCSVNNIAIDSINPIYYRCEYCLKNCGFKCLK